MTDLFTLTVDEKRTLAITDQLPLTRACEMVSELQVLVDRFMADARELAARYEDEGRAAGGNIVPVDFNAGRRHG